MVWGPVARDKGKGRDLKTTSNIKDVARRAGVSISTVSRVINESGPSSLKTRDAVLRAIDEVGFRPSSIGRSLKTAKSRIIGVLVPSLKNPIFADAVEGIERAAEAAGYNTLLTSSNYLMEKELQAIEVLLSYHVEGLIVTVAQEAKSPALERLAGTKVPFVLLFNPVHDTGPSTVTVDNRAAAEALVGRLIALGHQRIGMVAGRFEASDRSGLRRAGYEAALKGAGLSPGPVIEVGFNSFDLSRVCARLCEGPEAPTALFCSTDMLAIATIRGLASLGLSVPRDMSVAGFDGISIGEWLTPSLATVVQPAEEMGAAALRHLLQRVNGEAPAMQLSLPTHVRPGESWGPPRTTPPEIKPRRLNRSGTT
jgi:DNA-binding LacI/PurR family transcriptional regulator